MNGFYIFLIIIGSIITYLMILKIIRKIHPFPIPAVVTQIIDNPIRRRFIQNPDKIAERMNLQEGMKILEIGPGKGSYTIGLANRVGKNGKVYTIDIQNYIIEKLKIRLEKENIQNIIPKIDNAYELSFDENFFDGVSMVACLPEIPNPIKVLEECRRVLKKGGILSLSELFIDPDYPLMSTEKKWAKEANFTFKEKFGNWWSYQLIFEKN